MTQFEQLKMLYKQLINISEEENQLVDKRNFDELNLRLNYKDKIVKQVVMLKKSIKFSPENIEELKCYEQKFKENEVRNIKKFTAIRNELGKKLNDTNQNIKLKSAYAKVKKENSGSMLDLSE
ncbi:hypothetical protein KBA27_04250 [bacterium]|nr:hypothetical protein [bacterium]